MIPLSYHFQLIRFEYTAVNIPSIFKCSFCAKTVPTMKGLRSHVTQCQICRDAMQRVAEQHQPVQHSADEPMVPDQSGEDYKMKDGDVPDVLDPREFDPPWAASSAPLPQTENSEIPDRRAHVKEVEDEEDGGIKRWIEDYPQPAGTVGIPSQTYFKELHVEQR